LNVKKFCKKFKVLARAAGGYIYLRTKKHFTNILKGLVCNGKVVVFYGDLECFAAIWYTDKAFWIIFGVFWYIFPILVYCTKKNLAALVLDHKIAESVAQRPSHLPWELMSLCSYTVGVP
jgi:hypothetical protein